MVLRQPSLMGVARAGIADAGELHGKPVSLKLEKLWIHNVTITTGLVDTNTTPMLMKTVESKKLQPANLITHRFTFDELPRAYEVFGNAAREKALKVIISSI